MKKEPETRIESRIRETVKAALFAKATEHGTTIQAELEEAITRHVARLANSDLAGISREELLAIAADENRSDKMRTTAYWDAQADIPAEFGERALAVLNLSPAAPGEEHYVLLADGKLCYVGSGYARYSMASEFWWNSRLLSDEGYREECVATAVMAGADEGEIRRQMTRMVADPPGAAETGIEYMSRLYSCTQAAAKLKLALWRLT